MAENPRYRTEQEDFWAGDFGSEYVARNRSEGLLASNLSFFSKALAHAGRPASCIEFGSNIGMNLRALELLYPGIDANGIEINADAATELGNLIGAEKVFNGSILDWESSQTFDLALIKGVLIHLNPDMLSAVYSKIYSASTRHILVAEYYNPSPVEIPYREHRNKLFKRDFAGEMLKQYPTLKLIDYGFVYRGDPTFPQDDITWFLLEKQS